MAFGDPVARSSTEPSISERPPVTSPDRDTPMLR